MSPTLNPAELLTLIAAHRLGDDAYGVTIRDDVHALQGKEISMAAVYAALDRLERLGLVKPWFSEPRAERGGRSRKHFTVSAPGQAVIRRAHADAMRMWSAVPLPSAPKKR